ncbi:MAG: hypothetical protein SGI98_07310 [Verrucomicrobiota bacterium]|nr:hypothetical protein [Verrucomicrobiota bacterium]
MKTSLKNFGVTLILAGMVVSMTGCETSPGTGTVVGSSAVGAGVGAASGALIGGGTGAAAGALIGGALGAGTGALVNSSNNSKTAYPVAQRDRKNYNYAISPFNGEKLYVGSKPNGSKMRDPQGRVFVVGE